MVMDGVLLRLEGQSGADESRSVHTGNRHREGRFLMMVPRREALSAGILISKEEEMERKH